MKYIATDRDTTRALRQLIRNAEASVNGPKSFSGSTVTGPVIAKVLTSIAAGDATLQTAALMTIRDGAIIATGQTVLIRHVGTGPVAADTVVITEPCGKLGQCFVRNSTPATSQNVTVERYMTLVGPVTPDAGHENKAWETYSFAGFNLHCKWRSTDSVTSVNPINGVSLWSYQMNPIRFAIEGYHNSYYGLRTDLFNSLNVPVVGLSSLLPPADSHLLLDLASVEIPYGGFNHFWYFGPGQSTTEVFTTHYRVWIDGTDMTEVVELGAPVPHLQIYNLIRPRRFGPMSAAVSLPSGSYTAKTVWVDLWVTVNVYGQTWMSGEYPACDVDPLCANNRMRFNFANANANRNTGDQYRFSFADNGPAGLSELVGETAGGWTYTEQSAALSLSKSGTGSLGLNWATESPVLTLNITAQNNQPANGANPSMRYMPVDSGDYALKYANGGQMKPGVWDAQGSTVFQQVSRLVQNTWYLKGSDLIPASYFNGFPSTITVEKL